MSSGHSTLGALVADHSATGRHHRKAILRQENPPPVERIVPYHVARAVRARRPATLGALSPGDRFRTLLTSRIGMVLTRATRTNIAEPDEPPLFEFVVMVAWGSVAEDGSWRSRSQMQLLARTKVVPL